MSGRVSILICLAFVAHPSTNFAQGIISTVAGGTGLNSGFVDNIPATLARLDGPLSVALDATGNAYIGESHRIRRIDATSGLISTVAGTGDPNSAVVDGDALRVGVYGPKFFHFDANGGLLFSECNSIRKLDLARSAITMVVGATCGSLGPVGDISGFAIDTAGNGYVSDDYGNVIRKVNLTTGAITVIAGNGQHVDPGIPTGDGVLATSIPLQSASSVVVDTVGNLYFFESERGIRRVDSTTGIITTIAGLGGSFPTGEPLAFDDQGNLFLAGVHSVLKMALPAGTVTSVAGSGKPDYNGDDLPAMQANIGSAFGVFVDHAQNVWIADVDNARLRELINATGVVHTVAGVDANGDGGLAVGAPLNLLTGVAVNDVGDVYLANGEAARRIDHSTGIISTLRGVSASNSYLRLALDHSGNLFISESQTFSGSVVRLDPSSGATAVVAPFGGPIALDEAGNLFVADPNGSQVHRVDAATGVITTVAGNGAPNQSYSEGGLATAVPIGTVGALAVSPNNLLYLAISGGILKIDANGFISRIAGTGLGGACNHLETASSGDGAQASLASLCSPISLAFDQDGNLFISDSACSCVRRIAADTGVIQTVAGTLARGISGDSIPATSAALNVGAITLKSDQLYIVDFDFLLLSGGRIRKVTPPVPLPLPQPPLITGIVNGADFTFPISPGAIVSVFGNYLAPPQAATSQAGADGKVPTNLSGVQLRFDGQPAPLLYSSAGQINAVVPYAVRIDPNSIPVELHNDAGTYSISNLILPPVSPGIFGGTVFNPDGTINSVNNPAPKGATLTVYGTGMGQTTPEGVDGAIVQGPDVPRPLAQISAPPYDISFVGGVPGLVSGIMRADIRIPDSTLPGHRNFLLFANGYDPKFGGPVSLATPSVDFYVLSDTPVITGIDPPSPQIMIGITNMVTFSGRNFNGPMTAEFFYHGAQPPAFQLTVPPQNNTTLTLEADFRNQSGPWSVDVVNGANQRSNRFDFVVQDPSPPSISAIDFTLFATSGIQYIVVDGANFVAPISVDVFYNDSRIATLSGSDVRQDYGSTNFFTMSFDFKSVAGAYGVEVVDGRGLRSNRLNFTVYPAGSVVVTWVAPVACGAAPVPPILTSTARLEVCGVNFANGLSVELFLNGDPVANLNGSKVNYIFGNRLELFVNFANQPGAYAIQVVNPDGNRSNVYNFDVVPP